MIISRPIIRPITLSESRSYGRDYIAQEKKDGVFALREWRGSTLAGEQMRDGSFWAFDVVQVQGDDCRRFAFEDRLNALRELSSHFDGGIRLVPQGFGQEFLEAVLASGGEGVVFKHRQGYWGVGQFKAKRVETYDVTVTDIFNQSVAIAYENQNAGKVGVMGGQIDSLRVGDVIEIAAMCRTTSGKFREPRFIRCRHDKA